MTRRPGFVLAVGLGLVISAQDASAAPRVGSCQKASRFWARVAKPAEQKYCALVHAAQAALWSEPARAERLAGNAMQLIPTDPNAPLVLAHARLLQGDARGAHERFSAILGQTAPPLPDAARGVTVVIGAARAALLSGAFDDALRHYRHLVLRLQEVPGPRQQAKLLIEASTATSYVGSGGGREARAYLAVAAEKNEALLRPVIAAALALSHVREGDMTAARRAAGHLVSSWHVRWILDQPKAAVGNPTETLPLFPPGEAAALAAAVAEVVEPDAAPLHWNDFVELGGDTVPAHLRKVRTPGGSDGAP